MSNKENKRADGQGETGDRVQGLIEGDTSGERYGEASSGEANVSEHAGHHGQKNRREFLTDLGTVETAAIGLTGTGIISGISAAASDLLLGTNLLPITGNNQGPGRGGKPLGTDNTTTTREPETTTEQTKTTEPGNGRKSIEERRREWNREAAYPRFKLKVDFDLAPNKYAEYDYPNAEEHPPNGVFNKESFQQTDSLTKALEWIIPAVKEQTFRTHDDQPSGHANEMAASAELYIDQVHPTAETRAWGVYNPSHGTMMFYDENQEEYWHVDTTSEHIVKPEEALSHREIWSPFHKYNPDKPEEGGFHPGKSQVKGLTYWEKSKVSMGSLLRMVASGESKTGIGKKIFITDEWLDDAYEHIRNDGAIDPILEPIEEAVEDQIETGEYAGIYGTLDDTRTVAGELDDVYHDVMREPEVMTTEKVESMLESGAA